MTDPTTIPDPGTLPVGDMRHAGIADPNVVTHPGYYWVTIFGLTATYVISGYLLGNIDITLAGNLFSIGKLIWVSGTLHYIAGIRILNADIIGGILVFGKPTINNIIGGLWIVPPGIFKLPTFPLLTQEMEIPAEPQHIWRDEVSPPADRPEVRPPFRVTFKEGTDKGDPLQRRVTEEVSFFVRMRIENFFNFYVRIGSIAEAKHQLEDLGVSMLTEVLPNATLSEAITEAEKYSQSLADHLRDSVARSSWGVKIVTARVKQFLLSKSLNTAIQSMAESSAAKITTITNAEATKEKLTLEGQGVANAIKAELDARTDGMKRMASELGVEGKDVLGAETARAIGESPATKVVVGTDGFRQLAGVGVAIAESIKPGATPSPTNPPAQTQPGGTP
jgi:regulator of protease activity HflC (stomatin/prohibitin superfamily)